MNPSIRDIAIIMDPVQPPASLRELAKRHRWVTGEPSTPISLRSITNRHTEPNNIIRFLSYNTFLMDGVEIPLSLFDLANLLNKLQITAPELIVRLGIGISELIEKLAIDAAEVLARKYGSKGLAEFLGVAGKVVDLLSDIANFLTGGVLDWGKVTIQKVLEIAGFDDAVDAIIKLGLSPLEVLEIMGIDPMEALARLGITIARVLGADIPDPLTVGAKPALRERASEIGNELIKPMNLAHGIDKSYEIIALCEVWTEDARNRIAAANPNNIYVPGPDKSHPKALKGSGLYQIFHNRKIMESQTMVFDNRGDEFRDADYWASKGVLTADKS